MSEPTPAALSPVTAARVDWGKIDDSARREVRSTDRRKSQAEKTPTELPADYPERVQRVFKETRQEFEKILRPLHRQLNLALWVLLPALGLSTAAGGFLIATNSAILGGVVTASSLAGAFELLRRSWRLGKDQVILELIPQSYETLFALCSSPAEFSLVFDAMREEFIAMRKNLRP